jgi:hypothetical protein
MLAQELGRFCRDGTPNNSVCLTPGQPQFQLRIPYSVLFWQHQYAALQKDAVVDLFLVKQAVYRVIYDDVTVVSSANWP